MINKQSDRGDKKMNRNKELAKNTIILTVGKICTQFVSFLLLPLYTALLIPEEFGIVDLFNTYIALLVPIFNWQFENGLFRFMLDHRESESWVKKVFSTVLITNIFQSVIYLVFFAIVQFFIVSEYKYFLAMDVFLNIFLNTLLQFPRGIGNNTKYSIASFFSATSTVVLNVLFIAGFRMGALGMFWATVCSKILTILYLIYSVKIWRYFSLKSYDRKLFKDISKYSLPLIPNQLSWWVVSASDRTIISYVIGVAANGIYTVANKFSTVFITFYNIFNLSWTESAALHINDEDGEVFLTDTINTMFKLFSCICIGIIAYMPFVFPIMINEQYNEAYYQIPILMLSVLFQVVVGLYSVIYVSLKKSVEIARTSIYAAIINIVVDVCLVKYIGLYAASVSTFAAYASMAVYRYFHVKQFMDIKLNKKIVVWTIIMSLLTLITYYLRKITWIVLVAFVVTVYSIIVNKEFIISTIRIFMQKISRKGI